MRPPPAARPQPRTASGRSPGARHRRNGPPRIVALEALVARGAHVVALVRDLVPERPRSRRRLGSRCATVLGDLRDGRLVERALAEYEIDAVFHLGAQTIVEHALRDPANTMRSNIEGTWEVLDACRRSGRPTRIVVASSDKAYGTQPELPYQEHHPLAGRHPYDVSKSCTDLIAQSYAYSYDLPIVDHPLRQPLRGRRPELEPAGARHDPLGAPGQAAGAAQRRNADPRLPLRRGRGRGLHRPGRARPRAGHLRRGLELLQRAAADRCRR